MIYLPHPSEHGEFKYLPHPLGRGQIIYVFLKNYYL